MSFLRSLSIRWLEVVTNFNFEVEYQNAELIKDVDYLSRTTPKEDKTGSDDHHEEEEQETNALVIHQMTDNSADQFNDVSEEEFRRAQEEDAKNFHHALKKTCDKHNTKFYNKFKSWCDDYFRIKVISTMDYS